MKCCSLLLCLLLLPACQLDTRPLETAHQPNIVLILVDDLGWQDTSVAFTEEATPFQGRYRTPKLERMARAGVRFSNAYASGSVCTPTRSALLTGQSPARSHISDWTLYQNQDFSRPMETLSDPDWCKAGVTPSPDLLPELLRAQGYRTIFIGKAHFGARGTDGANPLQLGFDVNIAGHAAGAPGSYFATDSFGAKDDNPWGVPGLDAYHGKEMFLTEALTLEMERELEVAAKDGRPFFLDFSHYAVHTPIQADPRFASAYREAGLDEKEAAYASLIEGVDVSLGRLLTKLEQLHLADDTLIIFTSDNGGLSAHGRGKTPSGTGKDTHNAPLRSGKGSGYEGGIRVPFVVAWAGQVLGHSPLVSRQTPASILPLQAGRLDDTPIITSDLFVTLARLGGVTTERMASTNPEGLDLRDLLSGNTELPARFLAWNYPHKWGPEGDGYQPFTALRKGDWKIIHWYEKGSWELYNLVSDLGEQVDCMLTEPEVAANMQGLLRSWMVEVGAQRPVDKATGEMLPIP
ncbi:MAG: sulfatase [Planctomycetota bacterium]|nr:MAG: sulfatase [Planctomycetota bacterium]